MEQTLAYKTTKNAAYNFLNFAWPIVLSFIATPILVHRLGVHDYGLYILSLVVIAFLSLLEAGVAYGFIKFLSEYFARHEQDKINHLVNSFLVVFTIIGVVGFLITLLLANRFIELFNVSLGSTGANLLFFYLTGLIFFVTMVSSVFAAVPTALQRFDIIAKWSIISATFMYALMVAAAFAGLSVIGLLFVYLGISVATGLFYFFYAKILLPDIRPRYAFKAETFKPTMRFSFFVFINNLSTTALIQIDRFFISALLGPTFITFYTLPSTVAQKTQGFISSISSILFPLSSDLLARGDIERLKKIYRRATRVIFILAFAVSAVLFVFGYSILFHWLGEELAIKGITVLYYLIPTYFFLALFIPTNNFLLGLGQSALLSRFSIILAILNVILVIFLIPRYSIEGAALAYLLSVLPILLFIRHFEKNIFFFQESKEFYWNITARLVVVGAVFYIVSKFVLLPLIFNVYSLIIVLPIALFSFFGLYKLFGFFEEEDWELFKSFFLQQIFKIFLRSNKQENVAS